MLINKNKRRSDLITAAILIAILVMPIAWTKSFSAEFTLSKLLVLNASLALAAVAILIDPGILNVRRTNVDAIIFAGLVLMCLSSAMASDPMTNLRGRYDSYAYGVWGVFLMAVTFQIIARCFQGAELNVAFWLITAGSIVASYAISQKLGFDPIFHLKVLPQGGRAISTLGSPVDLGAMLAILWPLSLWRADHSRRATTYIYPLLILSGLIASGTRGAWLASAVGTAAYLLMSRKEPTRALVASASIALMASLSAGVWLWREKASVSDLARRELWKTALRVFYQHPVLGWGPDSFEDAFRLLRSDQFINVMGSMHHQAYPHNDILHVLTGVGLIGLGLYLCLWFQIGRTILKALGPLTQRAFAAALAAGLVSFWVTIELNPVALEVLVFSAIVAGLLYSLTTSELPLSWTRSRLMVLTIVLIGSFFYAAKMALADSVYKDALRAQAKHEFELARLRFGRARRLMPCETTYIVEQVNAIGDWINASHEVNERLALLALADESSQAALHCHPRQATSHYIAGFTSRMFADLGFNDRLIRSAYEFDQALEFDPKFWPLLDARLQVARKTGDSLKIKELELRLTQAVRR